MRGFWRLTSAGMLLLCACQTQAPATSTATTRVATVTAPPTATAPAVTATRIDTLNAANAAYRSGNLNAAAGLYDRVLNTPPASSEGPATTTIDDFAHFRALLALLADSREDEARAHLDVLRTRDASAPLARLGNQLWDQYGMTGQLRGACAQLQPQITSQAGSALAVLQGAGVNIDGPTLCSLPQS